MKLLIHIILVLFTLNSCSNPEPGTMKSHEEIESVSDSIISDLIEQNELTELPEPFNLSQLEGGESLDFTSGILSKNVQKEYCDNSESGLYGRYNLLEQNSNLEHPVVGTIDIYKPGSISNWKALDKDQKIWKIHLRSDVISVWDSIHVGLPRNKIVQFGESNKGLCMKRGNFYYSCDFNNFSVLYNFKNDTLTELTVTRKCERK